MSSDLNLFLNPSHHLGHSQQLAFAEPIHFLSFAIIFYLVITKPNDQSHPQWRLQSWSSILLPLLKHLFLVIAKLIVIILTREFHFLVGGVTPKLLLLEHVRLRGPTLNH